MREALSRAAAILGAAAVLAACAAVPPPAEAPGLDGTAWILAALPGHAPLSEATPTLHFEGGRVQGTDGCNRYVAAYTAVGSALGIDARAAATMMACPPAVTAQAEAFVRALMAARTYRIADGRLQLLGADRAVLATFAPQPQSLAETTWRVTGYNNGKEAVVSVLADTTLTMAFSADGRASGLAGCNRYYAPYTLNGPKLALGPVAATRMMCARPDRIMDQERQFLAALAMVAVARFEGDRLELRAADGALAVTLTRAGAP